MVKSFARHYMTNEPMPDEMLQRLCASKRLFAASEMQVQVFYSMLDQRYHGQHPLPGSTTDILSEVQSKYFGIPYVSGTVSGLTVYYRFIFMCLRVAKCNPQEDIQGRHTKLNTTGIIINCLLFYILGKFTVD